MAEITPEQARAELQRRELARSGRGKLDPLDVAATRAKGLETTAPLAQRIRGRVVGNLPQIAQTAGGVGGAIAGGRVGAPARGAAIGGTAARAVSLPLQKLFQGGIQALNEADKKAMGKDIFATAISETLLAPISAFTAGAGKGALEALIGKRVTERGLKEGFKRFLDPKFYQDRVPKEIVTKTSKFFDKLDSVLGRNVQKAVLKKDAIGRTIKFQPIKQDAKRLLKEAGADTIEDLGSPTIAKAQKNKLKEFINMIDRVEQKDLKISSVWKIRKNMDKIRFRHQWDPDVRRYMDNVRGLLNAPLKRGNREIAESFGRYSSVQEMKKNLEKKFEATLIDGDTFSPNTEQFANTLLGTSKDETVRGLRKLDSFLLNADDKIVEDLLDVAATESLDKTIQFMGVAQRTLIGGLGGQKSIAGTAAAAQSPGGQAIRKLINRGLAVGGTEILKGDQAQQ